MKHSKSGLFLMEMIVCILFFSLSAAVSAQMFAKSHVISNAAIDENHAVIEVNNLAEAFYSEHGDIAAISEKFYGSNAALSDTVLGVYFDNSFKQVSPTGAYSYEAQLKVSDTEDGGGKNGKITFYQIDSVKGTKEVYSLDVTVDVPHRI